MKNTLVSGATGFVGQRLLEKLEDPTILTRSPEAATQQLGSQIKSFGWIPDKEHPPLAAFEGIEAVVHLAGENVAKGRWNAAKKQRILDSRVLSTQHLVQTLGKLEIKPKVLVCASAIGIYGDRGEESLEESSTHGTGFLADVCAQWEAEAQKAQALGIRVVNLRIGVVLGKKGGAIKEMLTPFKLGVGGRLGSGNQWFAWVHIDDIVGLILHGIKTESIAGPVNAVSPNPVTNLDFTRALGSVLHRPTIFPMPEPILHLVLGEFASVLLASQKVLPLVAQQSGYAFKYPQLVQALRDTVS